MSKKTFTEETELQKLTLSPTKYEHGTKTRYAPSPQKTSGELPLNEKHKVEKSFSGSSVGNRVPSFKVSTPNNQGFSKMNYLSEKKLDPRKYDRPSVSIPRKKDASDVQQIEKKLLQLMDDFETGKLKAFGQDSRLRQMEEIREQQERLARMHFEVGAEEDLYPPLSEDGLRISEENMKTLMAKLAQLSESIENLQTNTYADRKPGPADEKHSTIPPHPIITETPPLVPPPPSQHLRHDLSSHPPPSNPHHAKPSLNIFTAKHKDSHPASGAHFDPPPNSIQISSHAHKTNAPPPSTIPTHEPNTSSQIKFANNRF